MGDVVRPDFFHGAGKPTFRRETDATLIPFNARRLLRDDGTRLAALDAAYEEALSRLGRALDDEDYDP